MRMSMDIRCDELYHLGHNDPVFIGHLARFLSGENEWKSINELRKIYNESVGIKEPCSNLISEEELIEDMIEHGFYFGGKSKYFVQFGPYVGKRSGVMLDQPLKIEYNNPFHQAAFFYFFAYYFIKIGHGDLQEEFLSFHLSNTFDNDQKKYRRFLIKIIEDEEGKLMLASHARFINQWIEDELSDRESSNTKSIKDIKSVSGGKPNLNTITLEMLVVPTSRLIILRQKLVELQILTPNTFKLIHKGKGHKTKAAALIQTLENRGYFSKRLTVQEIADLVKNSFGFEITTRLVYDAIKPENLKEINEFKSIPYPSQIS